MLTKPLPNCLVWDDVLPVSDSISGTGIESHARVVPSSLCCTNQNTVQKDPPLFTCAHRTERKVLPQNTHTHQLTQNTARGACGQVSGCCRWMRCCCLHCFVYNNERWAANYDCDAGARKVWEYRYRSERATNAMSSVLLDADTSWLGFDKHRKQKSKFAKWFLEFSFEKQYVCASKINSINMLSRIIDWAHLMIQNTYKYLYNIQKDSLLFFV